MHGDSGQGNESLAPGLGHPDRIEPGLLGPTRKTDDICHGQLVAGESEAEPHILLLSRTPIPYTRPGLVNQGEHPLQGEGNRVDPSPQRCQGGRHGVGCGGRRCLLKRMFNDTPETCVNALPSDGGPLRLITGFIGRNEDRLGARRRGGGRPWVRGDEEVRYGFFPCLGRRVPGSLLGVLYGPLSLVRNVSEIANLVALFWQEPNAVREWLDCPEDKRQSRFAPVKVRLRLEKNGNLLAVDKDRYKKLSDSIVHFSPSTRPGAHNKPGLPILGGVVQESGLRFAITELAWMVATVAGPIGHLAIIPEERRKELVEASISLLNAVPYQSQEN